MLLKKKKKRRFHSDRRGLYAKESNAPQTLCAEIRRRARRPEATGAKAATRGGLSARGAEGARVPAGARLRA